jgi:hypothetical protein
LSGEKSDCEVRRANVATLQATISGPGGTLFRRNALDPRFFPKQKTFGLTIVMRRSVTSKFFQVYGVGQESWVSVSACVVSMFEDLETMPAERKHLGHERNALKFALIVQSS